MLGQGVIPRVVDPLIASVPVSEIEAKLKLLRHAMNEYADTLSPHEIALRDYGATSAA
jgi:hypothetical protein